MVDQEQVVTNEIEKDILEICMPRGKVLLLKANHSVTAFQCESSLTVEEKQQLQQRKATSRKNEFSRSRWLYHQHLEQHFGELSRNSHGYPATRMGTPISITHKNNHVAIAYGTNCSWIGTDLEDTSKVHDGLLAKIGPDEDWPSLYTNASSKSVTRAIVFATKEALYKALYPKCHVQFWFQDAEVISIDYTARVVQISLKKNLNQETTSGSIYSAHFQELKLTNGIYVLSTVFA